MSLRYCLRRLRGAICFHPRALEYIEWSPERIECRGCGRWKIVHQLKDRNQGNGWSNGVYWPKDGDLA